MWPSGGKALKAFKKLHSAFSTQRSEFDIH
jgi:hypothetical protein